MFRFSASVAVWIIAAISVSAAPAPKQSRPPIDVGNAERVQLLGDLPHDAWRIVWGPKSNELSLIGWETFIEVLDASTFKPIRKLAADKKLVHFGYSPKNNLIGWSQNSNGVEVIDLQTGKSVSIETKSRQPSMAFSPDGKFVATTGYEKEAKLSEVPSGKMVRAFDIGQSGGLTPVFSPDGQVLAIGNRNEFIRLFDVATGKLLHELPRRESQEIKFSPNGRTLAAGYVDGTVALWNVADGKLLRSEPTGAQEVYTLDWSPKGDVLATAGREGRIVLWEPQELKVLKSMDSPEWVIQVRFSPDGTRLLSAGGRMAQGPERQVAIWGLPER